MWIPLRSAKMYSRIFGFQRRVWCPKWTPASSSCFMVVAAMGREPPVVPPPAVGSRVDRACGGTVTDRDREGVCDGWSSRTARAKAEPSPCGRSPSIPRRRAGRPAAWPSRPGTGTEVLRNPTRSYLAAPHRRLACRSCTLRARRHDAASQRPRSSWLGGPMRSRPLALLATGALSVLVGRHRRAAPAAFASDEVVVGRGDTLCRDRRRARDDRRAARATQPPRRPEPHLCRASGSGSPRRRRTRRRPLRRRPLVRATSWRAGEHLTGIARRYGTTVAAIAQLNSITQPVVHRVGQRLRSPVPSPAPRPAAAASSHRAAQRRAATRSTSCAPARPDRHRAPLPQ